LNGRNKREWKKFWFGIQGTEIRTLGSKSRIRNTDFGSQNCAQDNNPSKNNSKHFTFTAGSTQLMVL
jgi:hypothetical protein